MLANSVIKRNNLNKLNRRCRRVVSNGRYSADDYFFESCPGQHSKYKQKTPRKVHQPMEGDLDETIAIVPKAPIIYIMTPL